jgi:plasmid maintenance system antidote protein VapI
MAVIAIHPGEHLAEELKELDMSAAELARQVQVKAGKSITALPTLNQTSAR